MVCQAAGVRGPGGSSMTADYGGVDRLTAGLPSASVSSRTSDPAAGAGDRPPVQRAPALGVLADERVHGIAVAARHGTGDLHVVEREPVEVRGVGGDDPEADARDAELPVR